MEGACQALPGHLPPLNPVSLQSAEQPKTCFQASAGQGGPPGTQNSFLGARGGRRPLSIKYYQGEGPVVQEAPGRSYQARSKCPSVLGDLQQVADTL